ncbi:hypothetical protein C8R43DRAFT_1197645 [Mycena crocata]|nr:hypothetical protein C8R43DRAFT_1197645 [Mycena crocata]
MPSGIESLSDDVLIHLLAFCDVAGVLAISQTSKYLHGICTDQHLWATLVEGLIARLVCNAVPDQNLRTLPSFTLMEIVKRTVRNCQMWVDPSPTSAPTMAREVRIPCSVFGQGNFFTGRAQLLPGGRHIVVTHRASVMLLDATNDGEVLAVHETQARAHVHQFSAVLDDDGRSVVVAMHTEVFTAPRKKGFEIVRFSLRSADSIDTLLVLQTDRDPIHGSLWCDPEVCGNYAALVICGKPKPTLLLVDWAHNACILVDIPQRPRVAFIPGHLILAQSTQITVFEIGSLQQYWRSISDIDWTAPSSSHVDFSRLASLLAEPLQFHPDMISSSLQIRLSVYESPLEQGRFHMHMHGWQPRAIQRDPNLRRLLPHKLRRAPTQPAAQHHHFSLSLPPTTAGSHRWKRKNSSLSVSLPACFPDFEYAGMPQPHGTPPSFLGTPRSKDVPLPVLSDKDYVSKSIYGGTLTMVVPFEIVVRYYV